MGKLSGKTALVTGAARGIGRAYALKLASLGANVGIIDKDLHSYKLFDEEIKELTADTVVDEIKAMGLNSAGAEADCGNQDQVFAAVEEIIAKLGDISILVTNAGGTDAGKRGGFDLALPSKLDLEYTRSLMEKNFYSTIYTVNAAVASMKKNTWGKIVTIGSVAGLMTPADGNGAHYAAAKAAVIHYTKSLAKELGPYGITVNCICPGTIQSVNVKTALKHAPKEGIDTLINMVPLRRLGVPEDCAKVIEFLTTDLSDYVSGNIIEVSGGAYGQ